MPAWPGPAQTSSDSPLADGTKGCGRGRGMALNLWRFPTTVSLAVTQQLTWATASREGKGGGGMSPHPVLSNDNLVQPGWTHAFAASWANPLTLLSLVLLQSDCMIICVPISLSHSVWEQWKSGTKCTIVWMFGWFFNCCCCWPHGLP